MNGIELIGNERERQIEKEGFGSIHDAAHSDNELKDAAICYLKESSTVFGIKLWPWELKWWKPSNDPVRNLVKAGALIAAEIDRIQNSPEQIAHYQPQNDNSRLDMIDAVAVKEPNKRTKQGT